MSTTPTADYAGASAHKSTLYLLFGFDAIPSLQEVCGGFHRRTLRCTKHRVASPDERVRLLALGADLRAAWDASTTPPRDKKELLRAVLEEVIVPVQKQERPALARPSKAAFVTRLRPDQLPGRAARQLPD